MFTGIIEEVGTISFISRTLLKVSSSRVRPGIQLGDSIAVNGVCLTATAKTKDELHMEVMPETLHRSNLAALVRGARVNLESALTLSKPIGGHIVQGHVDDTGRVEKVTRNGNALLLGISAPDQVAKYLVEKAFIAVDGVSLTIATLEHAGFVVSLVGFTAANTTLGDARPGQSVNLEVDIIAKYAKKFAADGRSGLTREFLLANGYGD